MAYAVKVIKDSLGANGVRITTLELTFPRIVLAEFNTHRVFSRNSASSRAIPVEKMLAKVTNDPFLPVYWGKNQKGMQADIELSDDEIALAESVWLKARDEMMGRAQQLLDIGVHKQITNRLLEPFLWHTVIVTSTEWNNFFALRTHKDAQPEIRKIAVMAKEAFDASQPVDVYAGQAHLPLVEDLDDLLTDGFTFDQICKICVGRCARVSYLTHDGKRDPNADIQLCDRLMASGHLSPFEHVAFALEKDDFSKFGNFTGWKQLRFDIPNQDDFSKQTR